MIVVKLTILLQQPTLALTELDLELFAEVDFAPLGETLNDLLTQILEVPLLSKDQYGDKIIQLEMTTGKILCFANKLDRKPQDRLYDILADLLRTVSDILEDLIQGLNIDIRGFFYLMLDLLKTLGLNINTKVTLQLTKLLRTDIRAFFHT
ncbi:uncharacterized protein LOC129000352 [Macrosteles quadrilineatus]|uniref:uncharacterized protein LOC129000352 n=1 Tax=Macrosteles quadrilineatus TaxID=74068 RepID=UPI0023E0F24B|nr:uncharacterized protein LOC129000352 [Macrosteles quadrilineatus]